MVKIEPNSQHGKIQIGYLKRILGVRKQTATLAIYAETGRFPLHVRQKVDIVNYWARLSALPQDNILHQCLKIQESLHARGQTNWYSNVIHIINKCGITNLESETSEALANRVKLNLYTYEQSRILNEINNSDQNPKLRTYKFFKTSCCIEPYLTINLPKKTCQVWSKLAQT